MVARMEKSSAAMMKALAVQLTLERAGIWSVVDESWDIMADLNYCVLVINEGSCLSNKCCGSNG